MDSPDTRAGSVVEAAPRGAMVQRSHAERPAQRTGRGGSDPVALCLDELLAQHRSCITGTLEILLATTSDDGGHSITVPTSVAADSLVDFDVDQAVTTGATGVHISLLVSWD